MKEQRISKGPRKSLTPQDVIARIPSSPADISISIPTPELTEQGHIKKKKIKLTP